MLFSILDFIVYILIIYILLKILSKFDDKGNSEVQHLGKRLLSNFKKYKPTDEEIRQAKLLENIENYTGDSLGQKKI